MNSRVVVAYYRVSTAKQGRSGLGLEAQQEAIRAHVSCDRDQLVAEFTEIESGRKANRPELARALAACRLHRATLVIAKLDRLARNVAFVSNLMESGVDFEACDFPQANRLTIHILAAVAEHEARMASERTKAALAAAKARGRTLGGFRGHVATEAARALGRQMQRSRSAARSLDLLPVIATLRGRGVLGYAPMARSLNALAIPTPRGSRWTATQVRRVLNRCELC